MLGWIGAGILGRQFKRSVPILCITGPTESGKSMLQALLHYDTVNPDLGYKMSFEMRRRIMQRSPGVSYVFTSDQGFEDFYNVKMVLPFCRFQRIPTRESVLELIRWLEPIGERSSIGSMSQARTPEEEKEEAIYFGFKLILEAARVKEAFDFTLELERHLELITPKFISRLK